MKVNRNETGMTLLELLASVAILMVLVNMSVQLYLGASRLSSAGSAALDTIVAIDQVRDDFQRFCREATGQPARAGIHVAGPSLALWQLSDNKVAVLGHVDDARVPVAMIVERTGHRWDTVYLKQYPNSIEAFEFETSNSGSTRLSVSVDNLGMENTVPRSNTFVATLRVREPDAEVTEMEPEL